MNFHTTIYVSRNIFLLTRALWCLLVHFCSTYDMNSCDKDALLQIEVLHRLLSCAVNNVLSVVFFFLNYFALNLLLKLDVHTNTC